MSKQSILSILNYEAENSIGDTSSAGFDERAFDRLNSLLDSDRESIVEVLKDWLEKRTHSETMAAVVLANRLKIIELISEISKLDEEIRAGKIFKKYYTSWTEKALAVLKAAKSGG